MNNNGEAHDGILVLIDEDGKEHDFAMVDRFQHGSSDYAILVPVIYPGEEGSEEAFDLQEEAYVFRIELEEGEEVLVEVEDEGEWEKVASLFEERVESMDMEDDEDLI